MLLLSLLVASSTPLPEMIPLDHKTLLGRTAPDFDLEDNQGGRFVLSKQRGKPVVIAGRAGAGLPEGCPSWFSGEALPQGEVYRRQRGS